MCKPMGDELRVDVVEGRGRINGVGRGSLRVWRAVHKFFDLVIVRPLDRLVRRTRHCLSSVFPKQVWKERRASPTL